MNNFLEGSFFQEIQRFIFFEACLTAENVSEQSFRGENY